MFHVLYNTINRFLFVNCFSVFLPYMIEAKLIYLHYHLLGMPQNANLAFCSNEGGKGGDETCVKKLQK